MKRNLGRPACGIGSVVTDDRDYDTNPKHIFQLGKDLYELTTCSRVMPAIWLNKMSLVVSRIHNNNLASIHKVYLWELLDPAQYTKKPRGVSPTHVLSSRYTVLAPVGGLCSGLWAGCGQSWTIIHGWEKFCGRPSFQGRSSSPTSEGGKKSTSLDALERVWGRVWLHLCYASPKRGTAQCQARTSWPVISLPRGQWVHGTVPMSSFPSPVACCHRGLIPSTVYRVLSPERQEEKEEGVQESGWSESQKTLKGCRSC